jgi:two-component system response regulator NreC
MVPGTGTTLVLVDDHTLFRDGLRAIISGTHDLRVVGEAGDAQEARRIVDEQQPEVVVLDVTLPGTSGIAIVPDLKRCAPGTHILILTMHDSVELATDALNAGVVGYALKDQPADEILDAIRTVRRGEPYLASRMPRSLLDPRKRAAVKHPLTALSPREREIFDLAVRGWSNEAIASELVISVKTVETHRARINKKLDAHSTADLVRYASKHGLIRDPR